MSIWNLSDGGSAADTGKTFEMGGGDIKPIPANTDVLAAIDEAKWDQNPNGNDPSYIKLRWSVLAPKEYANRKIFQKVQVDAEDPAKADKARRMFAAIDANAGGKLAASGEDPDDTAMMKHLSNKPMVLKLMVWEMEVQGETKSGNWVAAVSPRKGGAAAAPKQEVKEPAPQVDEEDDSIPF
jgi:hypothetical protein